MITVIIIVGVLMTAGAVAVLFQKSLRNAIIVYGAVSLLSVVFFVLMKAFDVAITEAAIGAVLTTAVFLIALRRVEEEGKDGKK